MAVQMLKEKMAFRAGDVAFISPSLRVKTMDHHVSLERLAAHWLSSCNKNHGYYPSGVPNSAASFTPKIDTTGPPLFAKISRG